MTSAPADDSDAQPIAVTTRVPEVEQEETEEPVADESDSPLYTSTRTA